MQTSSVHCIPKKYTYCFNKFIASTIIYNYPHYAYFFVDKYKASILFRFHFFRQNQHYIFSHSCFWIFHIIYMSFCALFEFFMQHFMSNIGIVYFPFSSFPHRETGKFWLFSKKIHCFPHHPTLFTTMNGKV